MKKRVICSVLSVFVLIIVIVSSVVIHSHKKDEPTPEIKFESGIYSSKQFLHGEEHPLSYKGDVIPDKETALNVATQIFKIQQKHNPTFEKHEPWYVFYDEQDEFWLVDFSDPSEPFVVGGGYCIVLQKKDGKVLGMWMTE